MVYFIAYAIPLLRLCSLSHTLSFCLSAVLLSSPFLPFDIKTLPSIFRLSLIAINSIHISVSLRGCSQQKPHASTILSTMFTTKKLIISSWDCIFGSAKKPVRKLAELFLCNQTWPNLNLFDIGQVMQSPSYLPKNSQPSLITSNIIFFKFEMKWEFNPKSLSNNPTL